jgi:hypothetical protein
LKIFRKVGNFFLLQVRSQQNKTSCAFFIFNFSAFQTEECFSADKLPTTTTPSFC